MSSSIRHWKKKCNAQHINFQFSLHWLMLILRPTITIYSLRCVLAKFCQWKLLLIWYRASNLLVTAFYLLRYKCFYYVTWILNRTRPISFEHCMAISHRWQVFLCFLESRVSKDFGFFKKLGTIFRKKKQNMVIEEDVFFSVLPSLISVIYLRFLQEFSGHYIYISLPFHHAKSKSKLN